MDPLPEASGPRLVVVPEAALDAAKIIPLPEAEEHWTHDFDFQGRGYQLYKKHQTRDGAWYVRVQVRGKRLKHATKTNQVAVALQRAKKWLGQMLGEKWEEVDKLKDRQAVATLGDIFPLYERFATLPAKTKRDNVWSVKKLVRMALEVEEGKEAGVSLARLDRLAVLAYEDALVRQYVAEPKPGEAAALAKERALRTARSVVKQARSLFNVKRQLPLRYQSAGLRLPEKELASFMKQPLSGKVMKSDYNIPSQEVVDSAFSKIEELRELDPQVFKAFWLAVGVGLRRGEIGNAMCEHFVKRMRDGKEEVWYHGGVGKDSAVIEVPVQDRAWRELRKFVEGKQGPVLLPDKSFKFARRISVWMQGLGWHTEKKLHELRAYIGSLIFQVNPLGAMQFMRHKDIETTHRFYARYVKMRIPQVL